MSKVMSIFFLVCAMGVGAQDGVNTSNVGQANDIVYSEQEYNEQKQSCEITDEEILQLIAEAHEWVDICFHSDRENKIVENFFLSNFNNKRELAEALECYWSKEYVEVLLKKYDYALKETEEGLYMIIGDFGQYYDLRSASMIKVEALGSDKKKVYIKVASYIEEGDETLIYTLMFTEHGWVLQDGGSQPCYA